MATMQRRKGPKSLFKLSTSAFATTFIKEWRKHHETGDVEYEGQLAPLPPPVASDVVREALAQYVQLVYKDFFSAVPNITFFLYTVMLPNLRTLDLSCLNALADGNVDTRNCSSFEDIMVLKVPLLSNLVKLSLRGSEARSACSLPVCTDKMLIAIGKNCQTLKSLDISNNKGVTDYGLQHLSPKYNSDGCPLLEEIFLYKCKIGSQTVANLLGKLENLQLVGHPLTGLAVYRVTYLWPHVGRLKLRYVNNLGASEHRTEVHRESKQRKMYRAINKLCPDMMKLQIRTRDSDIAVLEHLRSLQSVEFLFNLKGFPKSPGGATAAFFTVHGAQLISVAITCDFLTEIDVVMLGGTCPQLNHLWLRCNHFHSCQDDVNYTTHMFRYLKAVFFRIGDLQTYQYEGSLNVIESVLKNAERIEAVRIFIRSPLLNDLLVSRLLASIETQFLKVLVFAIPGNDWKQGEGLNLSMKSVDSLIHTLPALETLGNLFVWSGVSHNAVERLQRRLMAGNFDLRVIYDSMRPIQNSQVHLFL